MSATGRPKGEYRRAQHEGAPVSSFVVISVPLRPLAAAAEQNKKRAGEVRS